MKLIEIGADNRRIEESEAIFEEENRDLPERVDRKNLIISSGGARFLVNDFQAVCDPCFLGEHQHLPRIG